MSATDATGHSREGHVSDLLPAYLNGTLDPAGRRRIQKHLAACGRCSSELASWYALQGATAVARERAPSPPPEVMDGVLSRIQQEKAANASDSPDPLPSLPWRGKLPLFWQLLTGQLQLVRREIWVACAVTMALGCLVALLVATPQIAGTSAAGPALAFFIPVIAAVSVAFIYGPENDPSLEVALATPIRPRLVLLARLTLVYLYDLALALGATAILALVGEGVGIWPVISLWIGPMLFLSALTLLLLVSFGTTVAALGAAALWGLRLFAARGENLNPGVWDGASLVREFWSSTPLLVALAALLFAVAILYGPRPGRYIQEGVG